jgi:mediator of RNA polymerase II transcription subunit 22
MEMSHSRGLPQSKEALLKSYTTRLKDDVKSMLENFEGKTTLSCIYKVNKISRNVNIF